MPDPQLYGKCAFTGNLRAGHAPPLPGGDPCTPQRHQRPTGGMNASPYNLLTKTDQPKLPFRSFGLIFFLWCGLAEDLIVEQHPRNYFTICISYLTIYDS